jgi:GNAT superfamily N-acetyltransferase
MAAQLIAQIQVFPATAERWPDVETVFGANGASAGCWCMFWRLNRKDYKQMQGEGNKAALRALTLDNQVPGVLASLNGQPVGWCAISPREAYAALASSRILKSIDDQPVWSIVCFFVRPKARRQGVARALLHGAVDYAISQGARIVESYPIDTQAPQLEGKKLTGVGGYMGIASIFRSLGFVEVGRASETQCIMRYMV